MKLFCVALFLFQGIYVADAQEFAIQKYTTRQGLGHSIVYRVFQDRNGFMWFSTDNGLTRYDGVSFVNYTAKDGLRSNFIFGLIENDSALMISSFGAGVVSYTPANSFTLASFSDSVLYPLDIVQYNRALWIVDRNSSLIRIKDGTAKRMAKLCFKTVVTSNGLIRLTGRNIYLYDSILEDFKTIEIKNGPACMYSGIELADHTLLVSSNNYIFHIDLEKQTAKPFLEGNFKGHSEPFLVDHDDNVWITDVTGKLWIFSPDLKKSMLLWEDVIINDLFQDADNNIWLATRGQGVWRISTPYIYNYHKPGLLATDMVFDSRSKKALVTSFNHPAYILKEDTAKGGRQFKPIPETYGITVVSQPEKNELLFGNDRTVYRQKDQLLDSIWLGKTQAAVFKDSKGIYWAGMRMGLARIERDFKKYSFVPIFQKHIIRSLSETKDGRLVVGADDGLYLQTRNNTWRRFGEKERLTNTYINVILYDTLRNGHWIGTNEGLFFLHSDTSIVAFTHPYIKIRCNTFALDRSGNLWVGTTNGLVKFDGKIFARFRGKEGLPDDIYKLVYDDERDKLYVLSADGVTVVLLLPFLRQQKDRIPTVVFTSQSIDGVQQKLSKGLNTIGKNSNSLSLKFSILAFKNIERWKPYYRINGGNWIYIKDTQELNFLELSPGLFTVDLQVIDSQSNQRSTIQTLRYSITAPFYKQNWFYSIVLILLIASVVIGTTLVVNRFNLKKELELIEASQKVELEQKALNNMLNPHFMNNALNSIQAFVTMNDQFQTLSYLSKFARLMRGNLEMLSNSVVTLEKEIKNIELYLQFEKLRFENRLSYEIHIHADVNITHLKIPSLVLQPFVENAIWHGILPKQGNGIVILSVQKKERQLVITIEDDGIGLKASRERKSKIEKRTSRGLSIIRDRLKLLDNGQQQYNFSITEKSDVYPGKNGVLVVVTLPVCY